MTHRCSSPKAFSKPNIQRIFHSNNTRQALIDTHRITNIAELRAYVKRGERIKYVFFWGHQQPVSGGIGKSCLSQWYEAPFDVDGMNYPTAEHYMMAQKARLFNDDVALRNILAASNPGAAKAAGRAVKNFDENAWVARRMEFVVGANVAKFSQNPPLEEFLLATGNRVLVEASPVDRIWGIGLAHDDPAAGDPNLWEGLNLLGFALMATRKLLGETRG